MAAELEQQSIFSRISQRHMLRWALAYMAGAWILLEFTELVVDDFGWAPYIVRLMLTILLFGLLAVLVVSWYHGEKGRQDVTRTEVLLLVLIGIGAAGTSWAVVATYPDDEAHAAAPRDAVAAAPIPAPIHLAGADPREATRALAVLPFVNMSGDPSDEYFSDGVTEDIIARVSRIPGLRVISRTSAMRYKHTDLSVVEIGQELGVDLILEGSVRRADGRVRIVAQLIDARTDDHLWSSTYDDRDMRDILTIQDDVARSIADALSDALGVSAPVLAAAERPVDPDAYEFVLRSRELASSPDPSDRQEAVALLEAALAIDSTLEVAYSTLAENLLADRSDMFGPGRRPDGGNVLRLVQRGLEMVLDAPELHVARLTSYAIDDEDLERAEAAALAAIRANPNYTGAHRWYALILARTGRHEQGLEHLRIARSLDPLSPIIATEIGEMLYAMGRHEEAIAELNQVLARHPEHAPARVSLGLAYQAVGRADEAVDEIRRAAEDSDGNPYVLGTKGYVLAATGRVAEARELLVRLETDTAGAVPPLAIAFVHAGLGEAESALRRLEEARENPTAALMAPSIARAFEAVREDPRVAEALRLRDRREGR